MLVVWEPVLVTDLQPPSNRELQRVTDPRAQQFWDRNHVVSKAIRSSVVNGERVNSTVRGQGYRQVGQTLWDTVVIYKAQAGWSNVAIPAYTGGPVVKIVPELRLALRDAIDHPTIVD